MFPIRSKDSPSWAKGRRARLGHSTFNSALLTLIGRVAIGSQHECVSLVRLMEGTEGVPPAPGVYSIHWLKDGKFVPIHRLAGIDGKGVLYIGSSKNLRRRLRGLTRALRSLYSGANVKLRHTFVYSLAYTGNRERIGPSELYVCFRSFDTEKESRSQEALALYEYSAKYGEPPPLNLSLRRSAIAILGLFKLGKARSYGELGQDLKDMLGL